MRKVSVSTLPNVGELPTFVNGFTRASVRRTERTPEFITNSYLEEEWRSQSPCVRSVQRLRCLL